MLLLTSTHHVVLMSVVLRIELWRAFLVDDGFLRVLATCCGAYSKVVLHLCELKTHLRLSFMTVSLVIERAVEAWTTFDL